jgi:seryl-tRNA synthetase
MEPKSNYSWGTDWETIVRSLSNYYRGAKLEAASDGEFDEGFTKAKQEEGPDKDDLEILNLLKGYLAKYVEQFFEDPDDVVREALKARDEEIKKLENKIKELEEKIDNLLLRTPGTETPSIPEERPWEPYNPYVSSPWTPLNPTWYGGGSGITLGTQGTTSI